MKHKYTKASKNRRFISYFVYIYDFLKEIVSLFIFAFYKFLPKFKFVSLLCHAQTIDFFFLYVLKKSRKLVICHFIIFPSSSGSP